MALVNCPECDKLVSEFAATCPNCGFSVREHFEELAAKQKAIDEFNKTHQTLEPNDDDWYKLFSAYDGAVKHLAEITKRLSKYRNVFFDGTSSISGIGFTNGWFGCIHDGYDEIIKQLKQMLGDFSNKVIVSNLNELEQYSQNLSTVRAVLKRWGDLIDGPLCSNEPAVLREADRRYVKDIAENSSMGFGIITSSFTSAALYAVSSSIKEVRAEMEAEKNKQKYIESAMTEIQRQIAVEWRIHFNDFLNDVELCHKFFLFEIGEIIFNGYLFSWQTVDAEFLKPERKKQYETRKENEQAHIKNVEADMAKKLSAKRQQYIDDKQKQITKNEQELLSVESELYSLGIALWGEKAKKRKELQAIKEVCMTRLARYRAELTIATNPNPIISETINYMTADTDCFKMYDQIRRIEECTLKFDAESDQYMLYNERGALVDILPETYTQQLGAFREFSARISNVCTFFDNNEPNVKRITLSLSEKYTEFLYDTTS